TKWRQEASGPNFGDVPPNPFNDIIANQFEPVRLYKNEPRHRHAAQRHVLQKVPRSGSAVVVAHSLGSVVIADILRKLPTGLTVDLLLTIGSPLAIEKLGSSNKDLA